MAMATHLILAIISIVLALITLTGCGHSPSQVQPNASSDSYRLAPALPINEARKTVVEYSIAQLGKPYKPSGNSPTEGFDCSGLVFYTHLNAGKLVPRRAEDQYHTIKQASKVLPGDLVFFTTDSRGKHIDHVGIYIGQGTFIHAPGRGKVVTTAKITDPYWKQHLVGAGSFWY